MAVGTRVGGLVGATAGVVVGEAVGACVGGLIGATVGVAVGVAVGACVGGLVGANVGVAVGAVGTRVGGLVGANVGVAVGVAVGVTSAGTTALATMVGVSVRVGALGVSSAIAVGETDVTSIVASITGLGVRSPHDTRMITTAYNVPKRREIILPPV